MASENNVPRKPLTAAISRSVVRANNEKYKARTVKMPDSMYERFTEQALSEGDQNISGFIRDCAFTELERRERERSFGQYSRNTGNPRRSAGITRGSTGV